jgi:hypothetical protein
MTFSVPENFTVTHTTDIDDFTDQSIGVFAETNGGIYTGYNHKYSPTDCICQVTPSTHLNSRIVGIITSSTQFASHGDALVRVFPSGTYSLGDLLIPDDKNPGYAKVASSEERLQIALEGIVRVKVTSLDTGIDNMVACFLG